MKFDFEEALRRRGVEDLGYGCYRDDKLCYRLHDGGRFVDVALRATFDRWANSTDLVISTPRTQRSFDRRMEQLAGEAIREEAKEKEHWARKTRPTGWQRKPAGRKGHPPGAGRGVGG